MTNKDISLSLDGKEKERLQSLEESIHKNLKAFNQVGMALVEIRDSRLYRETHNTFEEYCRDRWDMGRSRVYQLIDSASVQNNLSTTVDILPEHERQARPLTKLAPQLQVEAWQRAVETAPEGKVTAKHVKSVVEEMAEKKSNKEPSQKLVWRNIEVSFNNLIFYIKKYAQTSPLPEGVDFSNIQLGMKTLNIYLEEILDD